MFEGKVSLSFIYAVCMMEFQRFGMPVVRRELLDQCAYEAFKAIAADPVFARRLPDVYAWRSHQTDEGRFWHYPEQAVGSVNDCNVDSRHAGGQEYDQCGAMLNPSYIDLTMKLGDLSGERFDDPVMPVIAAAVAPYLQEELELRTEFERDVRAATVKVADRYKGRLKERFQKNREASTAGAH